MTEKDFGFKIKKLRKDRNMSQEELAIQLNISQSKLSKIENGRLHLDLLFIVNFCKCLSVDMDDFLNKSKLT